MSSAIWHDNHVIGVGGAYLLTSTDARVWQADTLSGISARALAWPDSGLPLQTPVLVVGQAAGDSGSPVELTGVVNSAAYGGSMLVHSSALQGLSLRALVWTGSQIVAVGGNGAIVVSPDGLTWSVRSSGVTDSLKAVIWTGSQLVAVGSGGVVLTSPADPPIVTPTIVSLPYSGGKQSGNITFTFNKPPRIRLGNMVLLGVVYGYKPNLDVCGLSNGYSLQFLGNGLVVDARSRGDTDWTADARYPDTSATLLGTVGGDSYWAPNSYDGMGFPTDLSVEPGYEFGALVDQHCMYSLAYLDPGDQRVVFFHEGKIYGKAKITAIAEGGYNPMAQGNTAFTYITLRYVINTDSTDLVDTGAEVTGIARSAPLRALPQSLQDRYYTPLGRRSPANVSKPTLELLRDLRWESNNSHNP